MRIDEAPESETCPCHLCCGSEKAFTRVDLICIIGCLLVLAITQLPLTGRVRDAGQEAVCLNNLRQIGTGLMAWSAENQDFVPEEGNSSAGINDPGGPTSTDNLDAAWYNLPFQPRHTNLVALYTAHAPPVPQNGSIFSCPAAPAPATAPGFFQAYFMYGMNARLCINFSTRAGNGIPNTRFSTIPRPRDTVFMAEPGRGPTISTPSQGSSVTGYFVAGGLNDSAQGLSTRHGSADNFFMCDGHVRIARTNEFIRTQIEANDASLEWSQPRQIYWYPTPNTPN